MSAEACAIAGMQRCLFGSPSNYCGEPAVLHVWIIGDENTMSCARHVAWWDDQPYTDRHAIAGACGMPDTFWEYSWAHPPGRCMVDWADIAVLVGTAEREVAP